MPAVPSSVETALPQSVPSRQVGIDARGVAAFSCTSITFARDAVRACAEIAGCVSASESDSLPYDTLFLSDDPTPCSGSCATKASTDLLIRASTSRGGTESACETLHTERTAALEASISTAVVKDGGSLQAAAGLTYLPASLHTGGGGPLIWASAEDLQRSGASGISAHSHPVAGFSSRVLGQGSCGECLGGCSGEPALITRSCAMSTHLQLEPTKVFFSPLRSDLSNEGQQTSDHVVGDLTDASNSEWPGVGPGEAAFEGTGGGTVAVAQCQLGDACAARHVEPWSTIGSPLAASAASDAQLLSPVLEVLVTGPQMLIGREPVYLHWCCAAHWRAVQRTERGAQWTRSDGMPADVYCVPAYPYAKGGRLNHLIPALRTDSDVDREDGAILFKDDNARWVSGALCKVKLRHSEVHPSPSFLSVAASGMCAERNVAGECQGRRLTRIPFCVPHVHSCNDFEMPLCEFCGRVVDVCAWGDSNEVSSEPSTPTDESECECSSTSRCNGAVTIFV